VKLVRDLGSLPPEHQGGAVAIGNFDGVHLGHARIIERLIAHARKIGGPAIVFTFDPPPARILRPAAAPPSPTTTERKLELLAALGVDTTIVYPTDQALLQLSAREFFSQIVERKLQARALVEGPNFFFGHDREGTIAVLTELCREAGLPLEIVEPVEIRGQLVSSSRVRGLLTEGRVDEVAEILTEPYRIRGLVARGAGRGTQIGVPTANLSQVSTLIPAPGVYAGRGWWSSQSWPAAINIGPNPTFGEESLKLEAHLIGAAQDFTGQWLDVDFLSRLRDIQRFPNVEALTKQLRVDIELARQVAEARTS